MGKMLIAVKCVLVCRCLNFLAVIETVFNELIYVFVWFASLLANFMEIC